MKKIIILISSMLLISPVFPVSAQTMSPAESFAGRKGTILEKRFDEIGKVGMVNIQVEYISDLSNTDKMRCVRFDIQTNDNSPGPSALLDTAEVNGIINFLDYINANILNHPPVDPNTEVSVVSQFKI